MKALVIDDSRAMRRILVQILTSLDFTVIEAGNGQEGLDQLAQHPDVSLVLVDWNMPVMTGIEFVERTRAMSEYDEIQLVMVTTETAPTQMAKALMSGVDEFVMKPFTAEILIEKLNLIGISISC